MILCVLFPAARYPGGQVRRSKQHKCRGNHGEYTEMDDSVKTILLVEDQAIIAASEARILRGMGYEVVKALSGKEAVEIVESQPIDLVLMDIDLGRDVMDGTEAASEILKKRDLPIVFLSSHTEPEIVEKTEKITSYGYVVKNSGLTILDASIKMAFRLYEAKQELVQRRAEIEHAVRETELREQRLQHINRVLLSIRNINQIITLDPPRSELLNQTCRFLVEQNGYHNAWIVLLEDGRPVEPFFHHGFKKACFDGMIKQLRSADLPECVRKALDTGKIIITRDPAKHCRDCLLRETYYSTSMGERESAGMTAVIKHSGLVYGWLSVSVPFEYARDPDEHEMFQDIVDDVGYALHKNDISREREEVFSQLRKEKLERESILDSLVEHVIYEDTELRIRWPNRAACESAGLEREKLIGRHCYEVWPNRDTVCEDCPVNRALETGQPQEVEKTTADGRSWYVRGYPVRNEEGEIQGAVEVTLDITDRKKTQETLRATLDSIGDAVIATDTRGRVIRMNPVAEQLTGWSLADAREHSLAEVFHIEQAYTGERSEDPVEKVLRSGQIVSMANHTLLISRNGQRYQIADSGAPIRDSSGNITGVVLVFRDVSEEYWIREELKKNEDRLSKILAAANDGTWDWDLATDTVHYDRRYYEMAGYEADEFPHRLEEFRDRIHPDDRDKVLGTAELHLKGELDRFEVEFRFRKKDGSWIWIQGRGVIVERSPEGIPLRFVGTHTDISKRKEVEENLRTERRRLKAVLEGTNVGSWEWNVQTGEIVLNQRWAEIIGYTLEEIFPATFETWIDFVHPDDLKKSNDLLEKHFQGGAEYYECELRMRHKDGHWVWVLDKGKTAAWTEEGKPLIVSGTHQDITERKRSELQLHDALLEKDNLLMELQHRVKNSFNLIISMLSLQEGTARVKETREALGTIGNRVRALSELYTLLYQSDAFQEIELDEYCGKVVASMKHLSERVEIRADLDKITVPVKEAATVGLILTELVTNAINHAYPDNAMGMVNIRLEEKEDGIRLEVSSRGRTLPENFDVARTRGIGLQLVQALTEQHDGSLRFERGPTTRIIAELKVY